MRNENTEQIIENMNFLQVLGKAEANLSKGKSIYGEMLKIGKTKKIKDDFKKFEAILYLIGSYCVNGYFKKDVYTVTIENDYEKFVFDGRHHVDIFQECYKKHEDTFILEILDAFTEILNNYLISLSTYDFLATKYKEIQQHLLELETINRKEAMEQNRAIFNNIENIYREDHNLEKTLKEETLTL